MLREKLSALRVQDLTVAVICVLIIYLVRSRESYVLKPKWRYSFDETLSREVDKYAELPAPIITDIQGDGKNELIIITHDLDLQLLSTAELKANGDYLPEPDVRFSATIPQNSGADSWPLVLETGYLDEYQSMVQVRKQAVLVVMSDWTVHLFDHELNLRWSVKPYNASSSYSPVAFTGLISATQVRKGDNGLVVVGGRFKHVAHSHDVTRKKHAPRMKMGDDGKLHEEGDVTQKSNDDSHFTTFALSGTDGSVRWHHMPDDFAGEPVATATESAIHWKLGLQRRETHVGEAHWTHYYSDIVQQMPYNWRTRHDTRMELARFRKNLPESRSQRRPSEAESSASPIPDLIGLGGKHVAGFAYGGQRPHSRHEHVRHPDAVVVHHDLGLEILSLRSGRPLTQFLPEHAKALYVDLQQDGRLDRIGLSDDLCGIEGFTENDESMLKHNICQAAGVLGDISLRNLVNPKVEVDADPAKTPMPLLVPSVAARSGVFQHLLGENIPSRICGYDVITVTQHGRVSSFGPKGEFHWQTDVVDDVQWARATHDYRGDVSGGLHAEVYKKLFQPSIKAFARQIYGRKDKAVVSGWKGLSVLDLVDGRELATHTLPCFPSNSLLIGDFNQDGLNDVIVQCYPTGYLGFDLQQQNRVVYMTVVSVAVVLMVLLLSWCCKPSDIRGEIET